MLTTIVHSLTFRITNWQPLPKSRVPPTNLHLLSQISLRESWSGNQNEPFNDTCNIKHNTLNESKQNQTQKIDCYSHTLFNILYRYGLMAEVEKMEMLSVTGDIMKLCFYIMLLLIYYVIIIPLYSSIAGQLVWSVTCWCSLHIICLSSFTFLLLNNMHNKDCMQKQYKPIRWIVDKRKHVVVKKLTLNILLSYFPMIDENIFR